LSRQAQLAFFAYLGNPKKGREESAFLLFAGVYREIEKIFILEEDIRSSYRNAPIPRGDKRDAHIPIP